MSLAARIRSFSSLYPAEDGVEADDFLRMGGLAAGPGGPGADDDEDADDIPAPVDDDRYGGEDDEEDAFDPDADSDEMDDLDDLEEVEDLDDDDDGGELDDPFSGGGYGGGVDMDEDEDL